MAIGNLQVLIVFALIIIGISYYKTWKLKDSIYCTFRRKDKTQISKFAKINQGRIDFDGGWYILDIKCTTLKFVMVNQIIPTWVRCLDYHDGAAHPLNPETFSASYDSPQERKALDRTQSIQSLMTKQNNMKFLSGASGKKGMLESLLPILTIAGFLILGYLVWKMQANIDLIGNGQNFMEGQLDQLLKK